MPSIANVSAENEVTILTEVTWSTQLLAIVLAAVFCGLLLLSVVIVVGLLVYKQTRRSSGGGGATSGTASPRDTIKDASSLSAEDEERRWKAEDNPHNRWHKLSFSEEADDDREQTDADLHKKRLLRTGSVSE